MKHFLRQQHVLPNGQTWTTYKALIHTHSNGFKRIKKQASEKARHTMAASQAGSHRSFIVKYESQLRGCLAEACARVLIEEYAVDAGLQVSVIRYDDVRTDGLKSARGEFDLKIMVEGKTRFLETRSSVVHDRAFEAGLQQYDIIGPYISAAKPAEKANDFYIRPLYAYLNYGNKDFYQQGLENLLHRGLVELHFVGGTDFNQLSQSGYLKSMGQGQTSYRVIPILNGLQIDDFLSRITSSQHQKP